MKPIDVTLNRLAARQYSLAHRRQVLGLGMTARQIQARLDAGWLVPVHQSVYRVGDGAPSPEQPVMAACLATGGAASHRSAGALWGLRGVEAPVPEIILSGNRRHPLPGVVVHRTDRLEAIHLSRTRRIPVTTPARTVLDLGAVLPPEGVESALQDALMRVLRRGGLPEPVRQYEVAGVRLDFAYPEVHLGIEADSRMWHGARTDVQRNSDKGNVLLAHGWRVLHFTWGDVRRRAAYVLDAVARELALACPA